jgi:hypothetical protein
MHAERNLALWNHDVLFKMKRRYYIFLCNSLEVIFGFHSLEIDPDDLIYEIDFIGTKVVLESSDLK